MPAFIKLNPGDIHLASGVKVIKAEHYSQYLQAEDLVSTARRQSRQIIEQAEEAYQREKQRGFQEGLDQARVEQATAIMATLARCQQQQRHLEDKLVEVVMATVKKVIGDHDRLELTRRLVGQALDQNKCSQAVLRVHPVNAPLLQKQLASIQANYPDLDYLEIQKDSAMEETGCILETELGNIQATLSTQLAALEQAASQRAAEG